MKKLSLITFLLLISIGSYSQINLLIEGIDSTVLTTQGYDIPRYLPTNLTFRNNYLVPAQSRGFTLQCGSDNSGEYDNNLDGAIISGNKLYTDSDLGSHAMMAGYNINYHIKHNYIDGTPYGIVAEGNFNMEYTEGGIYYNIIKNNQTNSVTVGGTIGLSIYNNTFYSNRTSSSASCILKISYVAENTKIRNNIFYSTRNHYMINLDGESLNTLECDYNVYYVEDGDHQPRFRNSSTGETYNLAQWQAMGFDTHSAVIDPDFIDTVNFVSGKRLDAGVDVGSIHSTGHFDYGLAADAEWIVGTSPKLVQQGAKWQIGAVIQSSSQSSTDPVYLGSAIDNNTPSRLELTYDITLANIVPLTSAFAVTVNSSSRPVTSLTISGTRVLLTLASPVASGDLVTVSYTRPSANPLQTTAGGLAASFTARTVVNNVASNVNLPPSISIISPAKDISFTSPATIIIEVVANDPDGTVTKVEYFNVNTKIGEATTVPFSFTWRDVMDGVHNLTAVATDNDNTKATSPVVPVVVQKPAPYVNQYPVVNIATPIQGVKYNKDDNIVIKAEASDTDGTISTVALKIGDETIAEMTTPPYTYTWKGIDTGTYQVTAIATDNLGATTTSAKVEIVVSAIHDNSSKLMNLYPNPNNGIFSIDYTDPLPTEKRLITIVSLAGARIFSDYLQVEETNKEINLPDTASGTYILVLSKDDTVLLTKTFSIK